MSAIDLGQIHEPDRRRPDRLDGPVIRLRNGELWQFALPRVVYDVVVGVEGRTIAPRLTFGREWSEVAQGHDERFVEGLALFARIAERIDTPAGLPSEEVYRELILSLAFQQLSRNYRLDYAEAEELLLPQPGEPGVTEPLEAVIAATIRAPGAALARALQVLPEGDPSAN